MEHFVSKKPFDPYKQKTNQQVAGIPTTQWEIIWWKLKKHKLALFSGYLLVAIYLIAIFAEFFAPHNLHTRYTDYIYIPPQKIHIFHEGQLHMPFIYGVKSELNLDTLEREYHIDKSKQYNLRYFCRGDNYIMWGLLTTNIHLICSDHNAPFFLMGTDRLGRDIFSRIIYGSRISLSVGLLGIFVSFILGVFIGGIAGYYGGWIDNLIQRFIEIMRSLPELPLWMALSAAVPVTWSPLWVYFALTIILGLLDWPGLARSVRSKFLSLREEDYCLSAELSGASSVRVVRKHLLPNFSSHLIASLTLSIPSMILGETALSFLGLGLRPPITSWGVLLHEAQNINAIAIYPWLIWPVVPVIIVVLAFNFLGDGLRDATDPLKH